MVPQWKVDGHERFGQFVGKPLDQKILGFLAMSLFKYLSPRCSLVLLCQNRDCGYWWQKLYHWEFWGLCACSKLRYGWDSCTPLANWPRNQSRTRHNLTILPNLQSFRHQVDNSEHQYWNKPSEWIYATIIITRDSSDLAWIQAGQLTTVGCKLLRSEWSHVEDPISSPTDLTDAQQVAWQLHYQVIALW